MSDQENANSLPSSTTIEELRQKLIDLVVGDDDRGYFDDDIDRVMAAILSIVTGAYEQGKNAGHAAQHAKDLAEIEEAEEYNRQAVIAGRIEEADKWRIRLDSVVNAHLWGDYSLNADEVHTGGLRILASMEDRIATLKETP